MPNIREMQEAIMVIGSMGSDAGYSVLTAHGLVHVPSNNPNAREAYETMKKSFTKLQEMGLKEKTGQQAGG